MGQRQSQRVPQLADGFDLKRLKISALEGFVLAQVDGHRSLREISDITGVATGEVGEMLVLMEQAGAITWMGSTPKRTPLAKTPSTRDLSGFVRKPTHAVAPEQINVPTPPPPKPEQQRSSRPLPFTPNTVAPPKKTTRHTPAFESALRDFLRAQTIADEAAEHTKRHGAENKTPFPNETPSKERAQAKKAAPPKRRRKISAVIPETLQTSVLFDPRELDEPADLTPSHKRRILEYFYQLEGATHYAILGVTPEAKKPEIRDNYFRLSKRFHPDRLFGKELGSFKEKMGAVFMRMTEAYEVLGRKKKRAAYDKYLKSLARTSHIVTVLEVSKETAEKLRQSSEHPLDEPIADTPVQGPVSSPAAHRREPPPRARRASFRNVMPPDFGQAPNVEHPPSAQPAGAQPDRTEPSPTGATGTPAPPAQAAPTRAPTPESPPPPAPSKEMSLEGRRRAQLLMAKKMAAATRRRLGRKVSKPVAASPGTPEDRDRAARNLVESLRDASSFTRDISRKGRFIEEADEAEAEGNWVAASTALRLALALDPTDALVKERFERTHHLMQVKLSASYREQALYEEETKNWEAAAKSWQRVSDALPDDPEAASRGAQAYLEARGDLRKASELARRACELRPTSESFLVSAQIYHAAGKRQSAERELKKALELSGDKPIVKQLAKAMGFDL